MIYTDFEAEEDIKEIIENTFDTCENNRDEIRWLISILRGFMRIKHKRLEQNPETYKLNLWQYQLDPILKKYYKKWKV